MRRWLGVDSSSNVPLQFLQRYHDVPCIVYCDLMKCGRPTQNEMNEFCELIHAVLSKKQETGVCIMLAPFLVSEKQSGYRGQLRPGCLGNM